MFSERFSFDILVPESWPELVLLIESLYFECLHQLDEYRSNRNGLQIVQDIVFVLVVNYYLKRLWRLVKDKGITGIIDSLILRSVSFFMSISFVKRKIDKEVSKVRASIEDELTGQDGKFPVFNELPVEGLKEKQVLELLDRLDHDYKRGDWEHGRISGAVYHGGSDLIHLQSQAFEKYIISNQLHPDVFPGVRKMESEVVAMVLDMFHGPEGSCGTTTSGGSESLLLACLAAKMYALHERGITEPEMIAPITIHAAVYKASYYFGIKLHEIPVDSETYKVNLAQVKKHINRNTVLLLGSAPNFPHGIVDDFEHGLNDLALKYNIPLHVDCCLGSFVMGMMERAGFEDAPKFDFRLNGVTSISCDTHKYGFAPKGSSVILYRDEGMRKYQYYINSKWTGGLYGSATLAGSRPGALTVGCWATMVHLGQQGYIDSCKLIINTARKIKSEIQSIKGLSIIGDPIGSVVAFTSENYSIYDITDRLSAKGWHLSTLQRPPAIHIAVTIPTCKVSNELISDLKNIMTEIERDAEDPKIGKKENKNDTAALYGIAGSVKTGPIADRVIEAFLDTMYKS
ncbi:Dihydrosphingosine phosphate lyase [Komagataella phaffii CBS 7435]|uniref:sphinganine-1-phosphate aldolase n=2 Tax=Komagataella phaffii TaxID=460519 RepID=C4R8D3_KOMPG|nr:Dihydrosphingosine phosphate lyase [Komagataella phaffii GS115]AOA65023.1 GQ67_04971T0 [Komagataella phaffii]CAH2450746.1 Dihydrosphingosine phosphate lyase [Komagataella phaffii CBS 7435]AOA70262.1 GQ68_04952T0 [Komagataella phaffii GS115]CAY71858.1 Dihydrosphingosine phosphate lyase [Komagataella phaffii GS115]CCA40541.1 Dihydrosphingosine phosphate lyase [Komagataella phaffii CBS 7435]